MTKASLIKTTFNCGWLTGSEVHYHQGGDSYTIFTGACPEFDDYLRNVAAAFDIETEADMPVDGRYVMLSTCEYDYTDARYVLHGRLVPVEEEL